MVRQESKGLRTAPRRFALHDLVYAQNWGCGPKWFETIIVEVPGPVSCLVLTGGGLRLRQHIDQLGIDVGVSPRCRSFSARQGFSRSTKGPVQDQSLPNPNEEAGFKGFFPPQNLLDQDVHDRPHRPSVKPAWTKDFVM
ncbi:hypothetical protein PR048_008553 [Dryococelus australis]|uniref:Uncharacterized protein n=1 Tax=Dryococelus australis TaxID=614101 RepID=A0ABQ9HY93_9NEOP|nr:hypothetical protein PR048_008553 [Dryococelus australis]